MAERLLRRNRGYKVLVPAVPSRTDVSCKIETFPRVIAADLPVAQAHVMAVSQRPLAAVAFSEPASATAWKTKPGWGIVSSSDHTINPDVERFGYQRAGLREVIEIDSSHLVMMSHPDEVAAFIEAAVAQAGQVAQPA